MIPRRRLPILMPLEQAGVPGAVLALPDALLRVWIEDKYRRDLSPGEHVPFQISPIGNPVDLVGNMLGAIPVGIDDTVQQATGTDFVRSERRMSTARSESADRVYDKTTGLPDRGQRRHPDGFQGTTAARRRSRPSPVPPRWQQPMNRPGSQRHGDPEYPGSASHEGRHSGVRESLHFDPPKPPAGTRAGGDGPLGRSSVPSPGSRKISNDRRGGR